MAVIYSADPASKFQNFPLGRGEPPEHCSWCDRSLADPTIYWHFSDHYCLWLHWKCAQDFGLQLLYDARRGEAVAIGQRLNSGVQSALRLVASR